MTLTSLTGVERVARAFERARSERRLALVVYLTVGFPEPEATAGLLRAALEGGADVVELGVPFSDSLADGTTIQRANDAALRAGATLEHCLREGAALVRERDATVLLMGYTNPFLRYGFPALAERCARDGIAGVIVPDLPAEESAELDAELEPRGLVRIDLYAPTTPDARLDTLLPHSRGFVYCVSLTGVTGARSGLPADLGAFLARVRERTALPLAVGFGIGSPDQVRDLRVVADGVVVGSAAIDAVARAATSGRAAALRDLVSALHEAGRS